MYYLFIIFIILTPLQGYMVSQQVSNIHPLLPDNNAIV